MVIINSQSSQLANRLWGFSSFIANSIEYEYPLVNLGFYKYKNYFKATKNNDFGKYPVIIKRSGLDKLDHFYSNLFKTWSSVTYRKFGSTPTLHKFYRTTFNEDLSATIFDLNRPDFVRDAKEKKILVQGWMFRDPVNVRKHREKILDFFKPVEPYLSEVEKEISAATKKADIVIGVHIRRGDYLHFAGGRWYYSDAEYRKMMQKIADAYTDLGKTCTFFIASNEKIDCTLFEGLSIISKERHFIVDLYSLAKCDAIIGPPSTFSQWAAFYGDKPLTMVVSADQKIGLPLYNPSLLPDFDFPERNLYTF